MPEKTELERVIVAAVKFGVYEKDNHWWRELCRLSDEIEADNAAQQCVHPTGLNVAQKEEVRQMIQSALDTGSA